MSVLVSYEKIPDKVKAFQAAINMEVQGELVATDQYVVLDEHGELIEVLEPADFAQKYRLPLTLSNYQYYCSRPHADEWIKTNPPPKVEPYKLPSPYEPFKPYLYA